MRAVAYLRASTTEQETSGLGLQAQRTQIEAACAQRGWELVGLETDIASGSRKDRPGLSRALAAIDEGSADVVVVSRLDRLSRSVSHFAAMLERYPSALVPLDLGVEPGSIAGTFTLHVVSAASEMERRLIGARTRESLQAARERGTRLGRPRAMTAEAVSRVRELAALELSAPAIAARLNEECFPTPTGRGKWHPPGVRRALRFANAA
jgi:DNA invertase Pin-like site-specific DNA recombinase